MAEGNQQGMNDKGLKEVLDGVNKDDKDSLLVSKLREGNPDCLLGRPA